MSKSPESAFYTSIRKALPNSIKSDRIESHQTSVGFPDLILHYRSKSAFIELKAWNGVQKYFPEIRKMQNVWFRDRAKVNVNGFVFAKIQDTYCLYRAETVAKLNIARRIKLEWVKLADHTWEDKMDWEDFIQITLGDNANGLL